MKKFSLFFSILCLSLVLGACGAKESNKTGKGGDPDLAPPTGENDEKTAAVRALSDEQAKRFLAWKDSPTKNCWAPDIFETRDEKPTKWTRLDSRVILQKTSNRLGLVDGSSFVVFDTPEATRDYFDSSWTLEPDQNGGQQAVRIETEQSPAFCRVKINGELAYETELWAALPIAAHSFRKPDSPTEFDINEYMPGLSASTYVSAALAMLRSNFDYSRGLQSLLPGWPQDALQALFPVESEVSGQTLFEIGPIPNPASLPVFVSAEIDRLPPAKEVSDFFTRESGEVAMTLFLRPRELSEGVAKTISENPVWSLRLRMEWQKRPTYDRRFKPQFIGDAKTEKTSDVEFLRCAETRLAQFKGTSVFEHGRFAPAYKKLVEPCALRVARDEFSALRRSQPFINHIQETFKDLVGEPYEDHNGWDDALKGLNRAQVELGLSLDDLFGPMEYLPIISEISRYTEAIVSATTSSSESLKSLLLDYWPVTWALDGKVVSRLETYLKAVTNSYDALPTSTSSLINQLSYDPDVFPGAVDRALELADETKEKIFRVRGMAEEISLSGQVNMLMFDKFLQETPDLTTLDRWVETLQGLKQLRADDIKRLTERDKNSYGSQFTWFGRRTLVEAWTAQEFEDLEVLTGVTKARSSCRDLSATVSLMNCFPVATYSRYSGALLDPSLSGRYVDLARQLTPKLDRLSKKPDNTSFVDMLVNEFFSPLWKNCSTNAFASQRDRLLPLLDKMLDSEPSERAELEKEGREILRDCSSSS